MIINCVTSNATSYIVIQTYQLQRVDHEEPRDTICLVSQFTGFIAEPSENFPQKARHCLAACSNGNIEIHYILRCHLWKKDCYRPAFFLFLHRNDCIDIIDYRTLQNIVFIFKFDIFDEILSQSSLILVCFAWGLVWILFPEWLIQYWIPSQIIQIMASRHLKHAGNKVMWAFWRDFHTFIQHNLLQITQIKQK